MDVIEPRHISREDLNSKLTHGVQLVNVLEPKYYNLGSIPHSLKIPLSELTERFTELDPNYEVITYCTGFGCNASRNAALLLAENGFNVAMYPGGITEWAASGLPVEKEIQEAA